MQFKNLYRTFLVILFIGIIEVSLFGQQPTLTDDDIKVLKNLAEYNNTWNILLNIWAFLGPVFGSLVTYLGLRKMVNNWAETEITKRANEKFGQEWNSIKEMVEIYQKTSNLKSKRIAVIGNKGKYLEINTELEKHGFKTDDYRKLGSLPQEVDINSCDLIILDNSDNAYIENDVTAFFDSVQPKLKVVYLAGVQLSEENYQKYTNKLKIIKMMDRLGDTIKKSF